MAEPPAPPTPAPMPSPMPTPSTAAEARSAGPSIVVRPMPKIVFFYMTWLASLVMGIIAAASGPDKLPAHLGTVWLCIFAFNLLVISFDFTEVVSIATIFGLLALILAGLYFKFLGFIGDFFVNLDVSMNAGFYFAIFGLFSLMYIVVFIRSRFEYWEFRHNEVLHRAGIFGEIKRRKHAPVLHIFETADKEIVEGLKLMA